MRPLILQYPITIQAPNFWGRSSEIRFSPGPAAGWWWDVDGCIVPITPECASSKHLRLRLSFHKKRFELYEHIGVLRFFGLTNVLVALSKPWPPHFGSGLPMWQKVKKYCQTDESQTLPWYTVAEALRWEYPEKRGGCVGFTEIQPATEPRLDLEVGYSYLLCGGLEVMNFSLPNEELLEQVCQYPSQGVQKGWYTLSKITSFFGWPVPNTTTWPKKLDPAEVRRRFVLHRAADLLGALSLLCKDGLFAGKIVSHCSGHRADIEVISRAWKMLKPLAAIP